MWGEDNHSDKSNVDLLKCQWLVTYMVSSPWWSLFLEDLWLSFSQRWWGFDPPRRQAGSFVAWPWRPGGRSRPDPSEAAFALCAARLQKLVVNSRVYSIVYTAGGQPLFMAQNRHFFRQDTFLRYFHTTTAHKTFNQNYCAKMLLGSYFIYFVRYYWFISLTKLFLVWNVLFFKKCSF